MSSFKQVLVNAIIKVTDANPGLDRSDGPTHEEARDAFIASLMAELFPEGSVVLSSKKAVDIVTSDAEASPTSGKKKRGPMSDEAKAAMKAKRDATIAAKKETGESPVAKESPVKEPEASSTEKKKRGPMSDETKAVMKAKRDATIAAKKETGESPVAKESPVKEPKAKKTKEVAPVSEDVNLPKIDPTWRKHLKKAAGDKYVKTQDAGLLTFLNKLDRDAFDAKRAEDHIKEFLGAAGADDKVDAEFLVVEFNGADYFVNPETKRVYEGQGEYDAESEQWTSYKAVGYAGMAAFADMELDE